MITYNNDGLGGARSVTARFSARTTQPMGELQLAMTGWGSTEAEARINLLGQVIASMQQVQELAATLQADAGV